ncbi:Tat binding protein 1-interacting protein-domain-containing protein [Cunninghamella echinulata]|nr:Tat binding protein 1-interacting protein-domain-containing protein [Cunninghamella echinulata]
MAPKKPLQSLPNNDEILNFLKNTNRPFSTGELSNFFQEKYTKTIIQKELDKLLEQQKIISKTFGKSVIYTLKQEDYLKEENQQLDTEINQLQEQLNNIQHQIKKNQQIALKQLTSTPTTDQAEYQLNNINKINETMLQELDKYKDISVVNIPISKQEKINKDLLQHRKIWKERKLLFNDILGALLENLPIKKETLLEEIDFEDDPIPFNQDPCRQQQQQ